MIPIDHLAYHVTPSYSGHVFLIEVVIVSGHIHPIIMNHSSDHL